MCRSTPKTTAIDGRRASSFRRGAGPVLILCLSLLATSCISLKAELSLAQDGSGTLNMRYAVSRMLSALDSLGREQQLLPFPLSQPGFQAAVNETPGMSLLSFASVEARDDVALEVSLGFSSLKALVAFVNAQGERASYAELPEGKRLSLSFAAIARQKDLDPGLQKLADAAFAPYTIEVTIRLPVPATSQNLGRSSAGSTRLDYSARVVDIIKAPDPPVWNIVWK